MTVEDILLFLHTSIRKEDIEKLVNLRVAESEVLDYKREIAEDEKGKKEIAKDVAALANTKGGIIIIGIEGDKKTGRPKRITPIKTNDIKKEKEKLENIIADRLEPLPYFRIEDVEFGSSKYVLVIKVFKTESGLCWDKKERRFYVRRASRNVLIDYETLTESLTSHERRLERIYEFIAERITKVKTGNTYQPLQDFRVIITFLIPLKDFDRQLIPDLYNYEKQILDLNKGNTFLNFSITEYAYEGLYLFGNFKEDKIGGYTLFHRKRAIEDVSSISTSIGGITFIIANALCNYLKEWLSSRIEGLRKLGMEPPYLASINLLNVKGAVFKVVNEIKEGEFKVDDVILPHLYIDEKTSNQIIQSCKKAKEQEIKKVLRNHLNLIWNSAGFKKYDG